MSYVFISYSTADILYALDLCNQLRLEGFDVWFAPEQIKAGQKFFSRIADGVKNCAAFIVIMSPNSKSSKWVNKEIHLAVNYVPNECLFPLLIQGDPWDIFVDIHYHDDKACNLPSEDFYNQLERQGVHRQKSIKGLDITPDLSDDAQPYEELGKETYNPDYPHGIEPGPINEIHEVVQNQKVEVEIPINGYKWGKAKTVIILLLFSLLITILFVSILIASTGELGTLTQTPSFTPSRQQGVIAASKTSNPPPTLTATTKTSYSNYTPTPTLATSATPTVTATLTATPSITPYSIQIQRALTPVMNNQEWINAGIVIEGIDGIEMVLVPAGCFYIGQPVIGIPDEDRRVCFDEPFWIDRYEANNSQFIGLSRLEFPIGDFSELTEPRDGLTWHQATRACAKRAGGGAYWRLPTEAQWEYAARGPENWTYPWGTSSADLQDHAIYIANSGGRPAPVGSKESGQSWVGAQDMAGNLAEWTATLYSLSLFPYNDEDGRNDTNNIEARRVVKGGSWNNGQENLQSFWRTSLYGTASENKTGFRCVISFSSWLEIQTLLN